VSITFRKLKVTRDATDMKLHKTVGLALMIPFGFLSVHRHRHTPRKTILNEFNRHIKSGEILLVSGRPGPVLELPLPLPNTGIRMVLFFLFLFVVGQECFELLWRHPIRLVHQFHETAALIGSRCGLRTTVKGHQRCM
jgi:hypothetical protein